jgi:4-diphosphocytidyl-2-C-methyl-D-erythritol kinase
MVDFPNAKINLGLYITDKRSDGYHNIASCFYPIPWQEALEIIPAAEFSFTSSGLEIPGTIENNLIVKAYRLLKDKYTLPPVAIHLHKSLPMGAGLGGGSADAAYTLLLLNRLFQLDLSTKQLIEYSSALGSDCAFFILNQACMATGRGEVLKPLDVSLKGYHLLLVHPGIHISTAAAYAGVRPTPLAENMEELLQKGPSAWKDKLMNQFEDHLFQSWPELAEIKERLYTLGAAYASMSGSGSAMYGIFKKLPDAGAWPKHYRVKTLALL